MNKCNNAITQATDNDWVYMLNKPYRFLQNKLSFVAKFISPVRVAAEAIGECKQTHTQ